MRRILITTLMTLGLQNVTHAQRPSPLRTSVMADTQARREVQLDSFRNAMKASNLVIPDARAREFRWITRSGLQIFEAPIVSFDTRGTRRALALNVDPKPGLSCRNSGCSGRVYIGVTDTLHPNDQIALPTPLRIELRGPSTIDPDELLLSHTRTLRRVKVEGTGDTVMLAVRPVGLPEVAIQLPIQMRFLKMTPATRSFEGMGLETIELRIAPIAGLEPGDSAEIRLVGTGVRVKPSVVWVTASRGATVEVRSFWIGDGAIEAEGPFYVTKARETVNTPFPWLYIVVILIGGLAGAAVGEFVKNAGEGRKGRIVAATIWGAIAGFGVTVGINLTTYLIPNPTVSYVVGFVIAAGAAYNLLRDVGKEAKTPPAEPELQPANTDD